MTISSIFLPGLAAAHVALGRPVLNLPNRGANRTFDSQIVAQNLNGSFRVSCQDNTEKGTKPSPETKLDTDTIFQAGTAISEVQRIIDIVKPECEKGGGVLFIPPSLQNQLSTPKKQSSKTFLDNASIAMTCETEPKPGFCPPESSGKALNENNLPQPPKASNQIVPLRRYPSLTAATHS